MAKTKTSSEPSTKKKSTISKKDKPQSSVVVKDVAVEKKKSQVSDQLENVLAQHPMNSLNVELAEQAIDALLTFTNKQKASKTKKDLLDTDGDKVHMQITLKRVPGNHSPKPIQIPVPHPVRGNRDCEICLFVKKEDKPWIKETLMEGENKVKGLAKVITLDKLRTSYARFEQRRELLATYDMFLADDRILPMLCKTLGKTFFSRKKQPIPVKVSRKESLPYQLNNIRDSTFMFLNPGTCTSICIGTTTMNKKKLLNNLKTIIPLCIDKIPKKWKNVQAIQLKTDISMALPILNKLPFQMGRLLQDIEQADTFDEDELDYDTQDSDILEDEDDDDDDDDNEDNEEEVQKAYAKLKHSKKRSVDEDMTPVSTKKPKTPKADVEAAPVSVKKPKTPKASAKKVKA